MIRPSILLIFLLLVNCRLAFATDDKPYFIVNSQSPDGKFELWVLPIHSPGEASGTVQVRLVKDNRIVSSFDWSGFGVQLTAPEPPFEVLWRKDSKYFAIKYEETRGWVTGAIYGRFDKSHWVEVQMPRDDYDAAVEKLGNVSDFYGKGCDSPTGWNANGALELLFVDRNLFYDHKDMEKEFVVTLKVADEKGQPVKTAKVISVREKTEEEVEKDLHDE